MTQPLLSARNLVRTFGGRKASLLGPASEPVQALRGVDIDIMPGRTLGLIGESGSGKSTLAKLLLLLDQPTSGTITFNHTPTESMGAAEVKTFRRRVQPVFQNPYSSLNPRMNVGDIIAEPMDCTHDLSASQRKDRIAATLKQVGLSPDDASRYPAEFSGGQRQRIAIARALAGTPDIIILDEPVSSLDISVRAQILNLLRDIQRQSSAGYLLITHDLHTLTAMCDDIAVMYLGRIIETGPASQVLNNPQHPYARSLFASSLTLETARTAASALAGEPPSPIAPPPGCAFAPRCPMRMSACTRTDPALALHLDRHVACHALEPTSADASA